MKCNAYFMHFCFFMLFYFLGIFEREEEKEAREIERYDWGQREREERVTL